jgi:hypothetical protein
MAFFQGSVDKGMSLEEFIDVVSLPVVFAAGQLNEVFASVDVVELFTGGFNDQVRGISYLIYQPAVGPLDAGVLLSLLFAEPLQAFPKDIEAGRGTDGLVEEKPLGISGTKEKDPIPVQGPLEPVMGPPDEEVGKGPLRGLGLIFPDDLPHDLSIFQLNGSELGKLGNHNGFWLLGPRCWLLVPGYSLMAARARLGQGV